MATAGLPGVTDRVKLKQRAKDEDPSVFPASSSAPRSLLILEDSDLKDSGNDSAATSASNYFGIPLDVIFSSNSGGGDGGGVETATTAATSHGGDDSGSGFETPTTAATSDGGESPLVHHRRRQHHHQSSNATPTATATATAVALRHHGNNGGGDNDYDDHIPLRLFGQAPGGGRGNTQSNAYIITELQGSIAGSQENLEASSASTVADPYLVPRHTLTGSGANRSSAAYASLRITTAARAGGVGREGLPKNMYAYLKLNAQRRPFCDRPRACLAVGLVVVGVVACLGLAAAVAGVVLVSHDSSGDANVVEASGGMNLTLALELLRDEFEASLELASADSDDALRDEIMSLNASLEAFRATFSGSVDALRGDFRALEGLFSGEIPSLPVASCSLLTPSSPSGYYWVRTSNGSAVRVYCDMSRSCGNVTGGWMRVASLDFAAGTNTSSSCPDGFEERTDSSDIHTCGIQSPMSACPSVIFDTYGITYARVCGKVLAYQFGTPNAFHAGDDSINTSYVDGVSLTHGSSPRCHIWTFAAALHEGGSGFEDSVCKCSNTRGIGGMPPAFVGQDYFCDSGIPRQFVNADRGQFFSASPLWDGSGCGSNSTCCLFNDPPWFHKQLPSPTSDPIEMRACSNEEREDEDIAISSVEIYVQ